MSIAQNVLNQLMLVHVVFRIKQHVILLRRPLEVILTSKLHLLLLHKLSIIGTV